MLGIDSEPKFIARYRKSDLKPQCLWEHLQDVSSMTKDYTSKIGLAFTGELLGIIHDLGKVTKEFAEYLKYENGLIDEPSFDLKGGKLDHSTAGAQVLYEAFLQPDGTTTLAAEILAITVASHHGFMDALTPDGDDTFTRRLAKDESDARKNQALSSLSLEIRERLHELLAADINKELLELLERSIEKRNYSYREVHFNMGLIVRFLLSCLIDADRINAADSETPENQDKRQYGDYEKWDNLLEHFEGHLATFPIRHDIDKLRRDISQKCLAMAEQDRGFFHLTVPTGGGKTLASLRFALHHAKKHEMQRIIYIIPYTSIIDQNAKSIREALGVDLKDTTIVLEHHSNIMPDRTSKEGEDIEGYNDYKLLAENWDSPIILTTMVQFMETLYGAGTNSCRRMHQLANSVIIFDEVQTLPINLTHLFNLATKFLVNGCHSSMLLCTATQPLLHEIEPPARALPFDRQREIRVTKEQRLKTLDRVDVFDVTRPRGWNQREIAELASNECNGEKSVLIIVNTKQNARNIFRHLQTLTKTPVYHLSTSMCSVHRLEKLGRVTRLLDTQQPFILVSTQLIEAGVDVDFDVVIRSLAGLDSIAQAAGRCNRHGGKPYKGRVFIVNSSDENVSKLPSIAAAQKEARRVLGDFERDVAGFFQGHLLSDPTLERYFRYYFHARSGFMDYPVTPQSLVGRSDTLVDLLSSNKKSLSAYGIRHQDQKLNRFLNQSFRTAARSFEVITNAGQGVIVLYGDGIKIINDLCEVSEPNKHFELLRQAQRYSVNCFSYELERLSKAGALHETQEGTGILYLNKTHYHDELGITMEKSSKMETSIYEGG